MKQNAPTPGITIWQNLLLITLLLGGCVPAPLPQAVTAEPSALPAATAEMSRDFTLPSLDGGTVSLSNLRGEWVVLNFWATWCPPCVEEMPYLAEVADTRAVKVLGVNFNEEATVVEKFVNDRAITFPILLNPDDITLLVYGVRGLPRTFVIAPDGTIAHSVIGQLDPVAFERWLDEHGVPTRQ